jgi:predicted ArsR family transcriptional regulator
MPPPRVTDAERRVLVALCRPLLEPGGAGVPATNQEIAGALVLSVPGVKSHVRALFAKFAVENRTELARRALELGVVTARDR